jgi:hypothetical protein
MFSILDKIKIIGTNSQLEQKIAILLIFGMSSIQCGQELAKKHSNFGEKSFIELIKLPIEF